jgi:hypothetical protein
MLKNDYEYVLMLFHEDGSPLGQASVNPDFDPAREWAELAALRRGLVSISDYGRQSSIQPIWDADNGEPYLSGFRVLTAANGSVGAAADFSTTYFKGLALQASRAFIEKGALKDGDKFRYAATAFPRAQSKEAQKFRLTTEEVAPSLSIRESALADYLGRSRLYGQVLAEDLPVFVPQIVLDEAAALSREAGARETGGILIGHLHLDRGAKEIFAEVTAYIVARNAEADLTKISFTSETWTEVRAAIGLRRKDEIMLGWAHSHPAREWCKDCPVERQRVCNMASDFFSAHDHALHRTVFPRAYSVALVVNDTAYDEPSFSMFGWRRGQIEPRGFHVIGGLDLRS